MNRDAKILIISPRQEGNTYQVAEAMKANTNADLCTLVKSNVYKLNNYDHVIVCSGVYGNKIHSELYKWLDELSVEMLKENVVFHVFLTWFGRGKSCYIAYESIKTILENKGLRCDADFENCYGGKCFIRRGHPNGDDLNRAVKWLKNLLR